ncbi:ultraviolet-B receptor UVR8-like isoform X1 [Aristolochia californica]|uniref:ultraviolet-B receptor UVR8-like isoform X1 n=1 Tax=Aristolochia californica TaxID=171875 RepID=UPI0035DA395A
MSEGGGVEDDKMEEKETVVFMWGYLPGASPQRTPLIFPTVVRLPDSANGDSWKDVCGGGCGFAIAISESGKLITWGSTDDLGQSYVTSGKHEETPEAFPLPTEASIVKAAAGWAHCVSVTENGEVYTWGWKECVPSGKVIGDQPPGATLDKDQSERQSGTLSDQVNPRSQASRSSTVVSGFDVRVGGEESAKRRRLSTAKQAAESSTSGDESLSALPCLVSLSPGVRIATVAAGGRHTLALSVSDVGQVWGWGYGGEGQLGLGSRIRMVSSPHPVPCIETLGYGKDRTSALPRGSMNTEAQTYKVPGSYVKAIACGGRHSAIITDTGAVLTFGWGLYGQCGQGSADDELSPTCVSSLWGIHIHGIAAGLWHTVCISADGDVYAFGGNQFGQLGTGADQAETLPRLLEAPSLENKNAKVVSCGARHTAIITEDEKVFSWGWNKYGQLGLGDVIDRSIPSQVPLESCTPKNVTCGWWHTLVLAESPT